MTTAEDFETIANFVYKVDPLNQNPPAHKGTKFSTGYDLQEQEWEVIEVSPHADNGFQAMAVVPRVNGVKDYSQVTIAYAGTNFGDMHDVAADVGVLLATQSAQAEAAMVFAAKVKSEVTKSHPDASFAITGHSLGGFLGMYVAAENRWSSATFNAPDAWQLMTPETRAWLAQQNAAGTNPLKNYVNMFDTVGNAKGNQSGAGVFIKGEPGRPLPDYHNIGKDEKGRPISINFDADGNVVGGGMKQVDYGVILYNLGLGGAADVFWKSKKDSPYPKVLIAMEPARALATTIAGTAKHLHAIRKANNRLMSHMKDELDMAKGEYVTHHQFITHDAVETCVAVHRLDAHHNIDHDAVASVNKRVDEHLAKVQALHDGIEKAIVNALALDVASAAAFTRHQ